VGKLKLNKKMPRLLNSFANNSSIEFDDGCFDAWCVFLTQSNGKRYAPKDIDYFIRLQTLGKKYGPNKIYDDFVVVYNRTTKDVNQEVFVLINALSAAYGEDALEMEQWLGVLYAGMIAEENKANAILKKRIKRLGMYQLLIEGTTAKQAANFSKGKKWYELDKIMNQLEF
jgi:hypothetical protein